jgi:hypothetical protein
MLASPGATNRSETLSRPKTTFLELSVPISESANVAPGDNVVHIDRTLCRTSDDEVDRIEVVVQVEAPVPVS